jgi:hypothetical protein
MANTLGTTNAGVIAQKALRTLVAKLPFLRMFTTDFTAEAARFGETVTSHIVTAAAAIDFDPEVGYAPSNRVQVDVPVTLNKHKHHTYSVGVQEASSSRIDLNERLATTAAYAIGAALVSDLCGLVKTAAYATKVVSPLGESLDGFDRKQLIRVGLALSTAKVGPFDRYALLNPSYYGSLAMDTNLMLALRQAGADAVVSGVLPGLHGFDVAEFVDLPDNGQDLAGFACTPDALVIATRIPDDPGQGQSNCQITVVTDEDSGLSLQVREWYNADLGQFRRTYTLMYGVAKGNASALVRIVTK